MVSIRRRPSWAIDERLATPERVFVDRRSILKGFGLGMMSAAALAAAVRSVRHQEADPTADLYPAPKNPAYELDRALTPEEVNANYNNFYEFGTQKDIYEAAQNLKIRPWEIGIDGLVEAPLDDRLRRSGAGSSRWRRGSTATAASKPGR